MSSGFDGTFKVGVKVTPAEAMRLAICEGEKGTGFVSPNPLVGCTIVDREHRLLSVGFHQRVGFDHAEVDALKKLPSPELILGAHVYVTLEPCAHQGRTPSCARTLAPLKPASLTYAVEDPNPLVAGQGAEILRQAGIEARVFAERNDVSAEDARVITREAEELAEIFLHNFRNREPFAAVKVASSLDGQMGLSSGESKWITGEASRERVQLLRARYDAVAVGRGTFEADDPSLNVRHAAFPQFVNKAVVFDPEGKSLAKLAQSNLLKVRPPDHLHVIVSERVKSSAPEGVRLVRVGTDHNGFVILELLQALRSEGIHSLMIEGGSHTFGAFFKAGKVHRLHAFLAPSLIGGVNGLSWSRQFGIDQLANRIEIKDSRVEWAGSDLYWTGRIRSR